MDMHYHTYRNILWDKQIAFPLERLHALIASGMWNDEQSKETWEQAIGLSYQIWADDPASEATPQFQDVQITCPWCNKAELVDLDKFTLTRMTKSTDITCPGCQHKFNADSMSAEYLRKDLLSFLENHNGWSNLLLMF